MRKHTLIVAALLLVGSLSFTGDLQARGPALVGKTMHNFSSTGTVFDEFGVPVGPSQYRATNTDQICVFCHTPHGGSLDAPLWNRDFTTASGYNHYTSAKLTAAGVTTIRNVNPESLICLSCHDGSVGVGDGLINNAGVVPDNNTIKVVLGPAKIGAGAADTTNDLTDDHPISVEYGAVYAAFPAEFKDLVGTPNADLPLFSGTGYADTVECSTCHDPHVNYIDNPEYKPFLAMSNAGSAMCLACHVK